MRYRLQRHDGTDCSATMVPITVLRMVPIQRYRQLVDYFLIRNMSMKYLWVVEFVIVLFLVLVKLYNNLSLYDMIFLIY